jgi:hypothetical protein
MTPVSQRGCILAWVSADVTAGVSGSLCECTHARVCESEHVCVCLRARARVSVSIGACMPGCARARVCTDVCVGTYLWVLSVWGW